MVVTLDKNLFDSDAVILVHQVNCKGVMGAGIAKSIRNRYPSVYDVYHDAYVNGRLKLGNVIYAKINDNKIIANICGQDGYGRNGRYTDYGALRACFENLCHYAYQNNIRKIAMPYGIGCGLAGGNWSVVSSLISEIFDEIDKNKLTVEICHLN